MRFDKLYIMGSPGSGKTVFADRISRRTSIPNFDLDDVAYRSERYHKISPKARDAKLRNILKSNRRWIIEGSYAHSWIEPALKQADLVIILKKKTSLVAARLLMRFIKRFLGLDKTGKGAGSLSDLKKLIGYAATYHKGYFIKHQQLADKYCKRTIVFTHPSQLDTFLESLNYPAN